MELPRRRIAVLAPEADAVYAFSAQPLAAEIGLLEVLGMSVIGVDPGVNGGIAVLDDRGEVSALVSFSGMTVDQAVGAMREISARWLNSNVYLEKVAYKKGDGPQGSFTFGKVYGGLLFGFKCLGMNVINVTPMLWMSAMSCMTGGNKDVTWHKARDMWPEAFLGRTKGWGLAIADAMLIAEFGRRQEARLKL